MNVKTNGVDAMYYVHTDHLGSLNSIYTASGTKIAEQSFDPWGRYRNPSTWQPLPPLGGAGGGLPAWLIRGYTGHEQLPQFGLINMNARLYDPLLAHVVSPDDYVQAPNYTQSYNRFNYCFNNPLKYTDPSGNLTWSDVGAGALIAGGIILDCLGQEYGTALIVAGGSHFAQTAQNYSQQTPGHRNYNAASNNAGILFGITFNTNWGSNSNSTAVNSGSSSNNPTVANTSSSGGSPNYSNPYAGGSELMAYSGEEPLGGGGVGTQGNSEGFQQNNATKQFIAIVAGESTNNIDEAAGIGSVMMNRLDAKNATLTDEFVQKIGGTGQYDAIGGKIYNSIMNSSWSTILSPNNLYANRISGAIMSLNGTDYSGGAYFWNASSPRSGFNWNMYKNGTFNITTTIGGTTFFKYSNPNRTWP